jgi:hypothetical protein
LCRDAFSWLLDPLSCAGRIIADCITTDFCNGLLVVGTPAWLIAREFFELFVVLLLRG